MAVFISRGMTLAIPRFEIQVGPDGQISGTAPLHLHFDVCPTWLELASKHLAAASEAKAVRAEAWKSSDEEAKAKTLEREFEASMQAIMAAAIALDAFYAVVRTKIEIPDETVARWQKKRTPRCAQVAEVLRQGFSLIQRDSLSLRKNLRQIYRLRDMAVHPSGKIEAPLFHPELKVRAEWRFVTFRADNAALVVGAAYQIIRELTTRGTPKTDALKRHVKRLASRLAELDLKLPEPPRSP